MTKKAIVIGAGFSGLSTAAYLAKEGYEVTVLEKNSIVGGRARNFKTDEGFLFDMGPSWYWLPGVFEDFFADFGHTVSDFYDLRRLDPSYRVFFDKEFIDVPAMINDLKAMLETSEKALVKCSISF